MSEYKHRILTVSGTINEDLASRTILSLLRMEQESNQPILVVIHTGGGMVESGFAIRDCIAGLRSPVKVLGTGRVMSSGVNIMMGAEQPNRLCTPNTFFMIHQISSGIRGTLSGMAADLSYTDTLQEQMVELLHKATGQKKRKIRRDIQQDFYLNAQDALSYGLIGGIVSDISALIPPMSPADK